MKTELNPNGTPQTSRWYDQVRAFTEAMGQPVGYDYSKAEKTLEIVRDLTGPTSAEDLERLLGSSAEDLERLLGSEGITVSDLHDFSDLYDLRLELISEEMEEVVKAGSMENLTKELADLIYVAIGMAVTFGLPLVEVFERVHQSNMSKLGEDGKPIYREDGKVMKGPNYQPPTLEDLF